MLEAVFLSEMVLRGGVKSVEVEQHVDGLGGAHADDDMLLRERRRETSRKFGGATILGMVNDRVARRKKKKIDDLRQRYSRAGLEEVLGGEEDEETYNRKPSP